MRNYAAPDRDHASRHRTCESPITELIRDIDCENGCRHPLLRVKVPSLDFQSCTENIDDPHLHATIHVHGGGDGGLVASEVPGLHLDRAVESWDVDDDHQIEGHVVLSWLTLAATTDTSALLALTTPSDVTLIGSVSPDQAAEAIQAYAAVGSGEFEVYMETPAT